MKRNAEKHSRKFYIMWDVTDWKTWINDLPEDLEQNVKPLFSSSAYAHQDGKPVICIWGIGFTDRPGDAQSTLNLINKLKGQGIYVIGGVPFHWRTNDQDSKPDYRNVYLSLNMLQPWSVGRFCDMNGANNYLGQLKDDYALLQQHNIQFQPVMMPGSAWSNMQASNGKQAKRNDCPRLHGDFLWQQFVNIRTVGIKQAYIAMFDEYDEGTAIAKGAEDKSMIPNNQYFLTYDADGVHCSSDFYLRLAGDGNRMLKGEIPLQQSHPTKHVP